MRVSGADPMPLVGVRQEVVAEAEHAFGNLFHRLHYFAQKLKGQGVEGAATLEGTLAELEDLLRLVLDYTSPLSADVRDVSAGAILGSLAAAFERPLATSSQDLPEQRVLADSGHLSEAFRLMKLGLAGVDGSSSEPAAHLVDGEDGGWLHVDGFEPGRNGIGRGRGLVVWALAQKLIEAQGGLLSAEAEEDGVRWGVRLPLPSK